MNWVIDAIYEFYKNPNNLAEFEEWRKGNTHNDETDLDIKSSSISDDNWNSRFYRN